MKIIVVLSEQVLSDHYERPWSPTGENLEWGHCQCEACKIARKVVNQRIKKIDNPS